jgi:2',3'-cyclic-nucleotide 2'-phosphodiesterase (5'-nucleotidase family)
VIGNSTVFIPRSDACGRLDGRLCESLIGDITTDALRKTYNVDFAITNAGGLRADLTVASTYKIAENDLMATGGDGYPNVYTRGTTQNFMDQVLADYITANTPVSPAIQGRIVCTTSGATACPVATP